MEEKQDRVEMDRKLVKESTKPHALLVPDWKLLMSLCCGSRLFTFYAIDKRSVLIVQTPRLYFLTRP